MGLFYKVTDAIDCAITDARSGSHGHKWAKKAKLHHTYYTIATSSTPYGGDQQYLEAHVFTKIAFLSALPDGAESLYNSHGGRVYDNRHAGPCAGLMTLSELRDYLNEDDGPDIRGNLNDYAAQPKRSRRAA